MENDFNKIVGKEFDIDVSDDSDVNNLYNNNIIKNYEDLINKPKFNKIIIEKKKQYGYIQFNKNGIFVTILDEYDNSLSKKENLIKNLELWIENNIEDPGYIQNMNYLINDIIKRCSINKLVEYKTANNEFIIEDDSTRELYI